MLNIVNGFGVEAGAGVQQPHRKIAFTGETTTGRLIMQYASANIIPVTLELGGKSPNIFFDDIAQADDDAFDKVAEGFAMFALNQGEVCTCPQPALIQESIYDAFLGCHRARTKKIVQGNPLTPTPRSAHRRQRPAREDPVLIQIGQDEGARVVRWRRARRLGGDLSDGYYVAPTIFEGKNRCGSSRRRSFAGGVGHAFTDFDDAMHIANDTLYGLAPAWSRNINTAATARAAPSRPGGCGPTATTLPAHAAFGGYKRSGIGRENHPMMLEHYQQTKNLLVSYARRSWLL